MYIEYKLIKPAAYIEMLQDSNGKWHRWPYIQQVILKVLMMMKKLQMLMMIYVIKNYEIVKRILFKVVYLNVNSVDSVDKKKYI